MLPAIFLRNFVCFSSVVMRRQVFDHVGGFDPEWDLSVDYDLWLRAARHYEFDYVDEELVLYRTGHGNLSKRLSDRVMIALATKRRCLGRGQSDVPPEVVREAFASTCLTMGFVTRQFEPWAALKWYLRAGRLRPLVGAAIRAGRHVVKAVERREAAEAARRSENASVNC